MRRWVFAVAAVCCALAGCATQEQQLAQAANIKTTDDSFLPYREYTTGGVIGGNPFGFGQGIGQKNLGARVDRKTGATIIMLQFELAYTGSVKRGYESARNARAKLLKVVTVASRKSGCSRKTDLCSISEIFQIDLDEAELRQSGAEGYPIKLFARLGNHIEIAIPKVLISSLFVKIDADKGKIDTGKGVAGAPAVSYTAAQ